MFTENINLPHIYQLVCHGFQCLRWQKWSRTSSCQAYFPEVLLSIILKLWIFLVCCSFKFAVIPSSDSYSGWHIQPLLVKLTMGCKQNPITYNYMAYLEGCLTKKYVSNTNDYVFFSKFQKSHYFSFYNFVKDACLDGYMLQRPETGNKSLV